MNNKKIIISLLKNNKIHYELFHFNSIEYIKIINKNKTTLFYDYKNDSFYILKKDNNDIPHVMNDWDNQNILGGNLSKHFSKLCLTMDKTFRNNDFSIFEKLKRAFDIVNETINEDPILERFKEIEFTIQPIHSNENYWEMDQNGNLFFWINNARTKKNLQTTKIQFKGETKKELKKIINKNCIVEILYLKKIKKFVFYKNDFYYINNHQKKYLFGRTGKFNNKFKKIIIVGIGAIGSHILEYLIKNGIDNIDIFENDIIELVNFPRFSFFNININLKNKAKIAYFNIKKTFPYARLFVKQKFYNSSLENYKENNILLINTTGGSWKQRKKLFFKINKMNINIKIWDIFVEAYGCAMHSVIFDKENKEINKISWKERSISNPNKDFRDNFDNCFVATLPYSNGPILVGIPILLNKIIKSNFANGHFTLPMIELSKIRKKDINKNINKDLKDYKVHKWK